MELYKENKYKLFIRFLKENELYYEYVTFFKVDIGLPLPQYIENNSFNNFGSLIMAINWGKCRVYFDNSSNWSYYHNKWVDIMMNYNDNKK